MIEELTKDLGVDMKDVDIKSVYHLGPIKSGISRPRSIKVHFTKSSTKGEIFRNIEKLQQIPKWKGIRLSDSLSPIEQRQQCDLRCIFAAAKTKGINTKLRGNTIIIDDIKYTYKDINNLPHDLTMEKVKVVKVQDGWAFQSHYAFLSSMYPCDIVSDGITYKSAEHFYSADMARHHERPDLIKDILEAQDGYQAKRTVRGIVQNEQWQETKIKVMKKIVGLKFDQNDNLRDKLLKTSRFLYEATKSDLDFACGMVLSQCKDICKTKIPGKNMLGEILCEYRDAIVG